MSSDEQLSLKAVFQDGVTGPLGRVQGMLSRLGQNTAGKQVGDQWSAAGRQIAREWQVAGQEIAKASGHFSAAGPLLDRMVTRHGFSVGTMGGVGLASAGIAGLLKYGQGGFDLKALSGMSGLTPTQTAGLQRALGAAGMSQEESASAITQMMFGRDSTQRQSGGTWSFLVGKGRGDIARKLRDAKSMDEYVSIANNFLKSVDNDARRAEASAEMTGDALYGTRLRAMNEDVNVRRKRNEEQFGKEAEAKAKAGATILDQKSQTLDRLNNAGDTAGGWAFGIADGIFNAGRWLRSKTDALGVTSPTKRPLDPGSSDRLKALEAERDSLQEKYDWNEKNTSRDGVWGSQVARRQDELRQSIDRLNETIKKLQSGNPTVQQQSFNGAFGGATVQTAAFGGGIFAPRFGGGGFGGGGGWGGSGNYGLGGSGGGSGATSSGPAGGVKPLPIGDGPGTGHVADRNERAAYIMNKAKELGIDPKVALRVAQSEGFNSYVGDQGRSFGDWQLFTGGGLGNEALRKGINVRDPNTWKEQTDFALGHAKRHGWGAWNGAKKLGIHGFHGIEGAFAGGGVEGIRGSANHMRGQYGPAGANLTTITLDSGKKVTVHSAAAESFRGFLNELEGSGYKINSLGGHNHRNMRGSNRLSQHAYGNAIDINPGKNPMGPNLITDMPSNVSEMAGKWGLSWGGDWKRRKDAMHFEWTGRQPWKEQNGSLAGSGRLPADHAERFQDRDATAAEMMNRHYGVSGGGQGPSPAGKGMLNVRFENAPAGMKVDADKGSLFHDVEVTKVRQMGQTNFDARVKRGPV